MGARSGYLDDAHDYHDTFTRGCLSLPRTGAVAVDILAASPPDLRTSWLKMAGTCAITDLEYVGNACALDPIFWTRGFDYGWLFE